MLAYMDSISAKEDISRELSAIVENDTRIFNIHVDNLAACVKDRRL